MAETATKQETNKELLPPENDPQLGYAVFGLLAKVLEDKESQGLHKKWRYHYKLAKNLHFRKPSGRLGSRSKQIPLMSANLLHTHRTRTVNSLCSNNPTFNVTKLGDTAQQDPETFDRLLWSTQFWWTDQEQQMVMRKSVRKGELYGITIQKLIFDDTLDLFGEVRNIVVDPFYFGWYPVDAQSFEESDAVFYFYPMPAYKARRLWPKFADEIQSDDEILKKLGDTRRQGSSMPSQPEGYFATISSVVKAIKNIVGGGTDGDSNVLVVEAWVRDYTTEKDPETGQDQLKYPGGIRCVTSCSGGKVVCSDRPNPSINPLLPRELTQKCYLYNRFPFIATPSNEDDASMWGMSDFEQLKSLQIEVDKTLSQWTMFKDKASRLKVINPQGSGVDNSQITNADGVINPNLNTAHLFRYMDPPQSPIDLTQVLQIYKDYFFLVAGTFDLESAQVPGREVIAYKAIAALLERAAHMLQDKTANYDKMVRTWGRMFLSLAQNFYTEQRWISFDDDGEEKSIPVIGEQLMAPAKITVVSGSTMPVSQVQQREEAIGLFKDGAVDAQYLHEKLQTPNRKNLIRRMQQGPFSDFMQKLEGLGYPPTILSFFGELSQMEESDFKKALNDGELPGFDDLPELLEGQEPQVSPKEQAEAAKLESEAEENRAQAEKYRQDARLVQEEIRTEYIKQATMLSGIDLDWEQIRIERAKAVNEFRKMGAEKSQTDLTPSSKSKQQGPYREKGMKSNNKEE